MHPAEPERSHLIQRLVGRPAFFRHAVCGNSHSRSICPQPAMYEDFLVLIFPHHFQKSRPRIIARKRTARRNGNVLHPQLTHYFFFTLVLSPAHIDHDCNSQLFQLLDPFLIRQPAAIKVRAHLRKIRDAIRAEPRSLRMMRSADHTLSLLWPRTRSWRDHQRQQHEPNRDRQPQSSSNVHDYVISDLLLPIARRLRCPASNRESKISYWVSRIASCRSGCVISPQSFCRSVCTA